MRPLPAPLAALWLFLTAAPALAASDTDRQMSEAVYWLNLSSANYAAASAACGEHNAEEVREDLYATYRKFMDAGRIAKMMRSFEANYSLRKGKSCDPAETRDWRRQALERRAALYALTSALGK